MPNKDNVKAPITLLGIGRSGTSLLEACFKAQPNIQSIGESSGLIFSAASGAHSTLIPSANRFPDRYEYDGHVIQRLLMAVEPSGRERWFHKPIGVPKLISWWQLPGAKITNGFPIEWYWKVLDAAFPDGKFLACLRNPWDVVLSWERFTGWKQKDLWRDVLICYQMVTHAVDRFDMILFFDDLINRPAETLEQVFRAVDLPMVDGALAAYDKPRSMRGNKIMESHRDSWDSCEKPNLSAEEAMQIVGLWKHLGQSFDSPAAYKSIFPF